MGQKVGLCLKFDVETGPEVAWVRFSILSQRPLTWTGVIEG